MKIKAILALAVSVLLLGACQHDQSGDPTLQGVTLELALPADGQLTLPATAIDQTIALKSGGADWRVFSTDPWLVASREGDAIRLKATSNTSQIARRATIEVVAVGATRSFVVEQQAAGAELTLGLVPDELDQFGGERRIDVNSNFDTWLVSTEAEWITVERDLVQKQIVLNIAENKARQPREATVEVRQAEGAEPLTFKVSQQGIVYWILPILDRTLKPEQLEELEDKRKSILQGVPPTYVMERIFQFTTTSPAIVRLDYSYTRRGDAIHTKAILADPSVVADGEAYDDFRAFMQANGFEEVSAKFFRNDATRTEMQVVIGKSESFLHFCTFPENTDPQATIIRWPWEDGKLTFLISTIAQTDAYQASIGGVKDSKYTTTRRLVYRHTEAGLEKSLTYTYNLSWSNRVNNLVFTEPNYRRIVYFDEAMIFFTEPFRTMLRDNGYIFYSRDGLKTFSYVYRKASPKVELLIEIAENAYPATGEVAGHAVVMTFRQYY